MRFLLLTLLYVATALAGEPSLESRFSEANRLYEKGEFKQAAQAYTAIARQGKASPALWFNLGNAYFKSGQTGRAIAAYLKAEDLAPRDPDIRANLQFAREQVGDNTRVPTTGEKWLRKLTPNEWTTLTAAMLWLVLILLALAQYRPAWKRPLRLWTVLFGTLFLISTTCLLTAWRGHSNAQRAVVVADSANLRNGPFEESQATTTLRSGAEVLIVDRKDNWVRAAISERRSGWVPESQLAGPGELPAL